MMDGPYKRGNGNTGMSEKNGIKKEGKDRHDKKGKTLADSPLTVLKYSNKGTALNLGFH